MNFVFILDNSISMLQAPNNQMNLLGMAKNGIEYIVKCRCRFPEAKYDHYHLMTTDNMNPNIISSWEQDFSHFIFQLKNISFSIRNDLKKAVVDAFEILNKFRDLTGTDNYLGGRDPYKTDNGIIIIFTDSSDILTLHNLETLINVSTNICKWDQQLCIFQMGINLLTEKKNQDKINYKKFETIARSLGGKHFLIETYELLFQILESFIMNFKFKVCFNLESLTNSVLTNGKFFIDSNLKLEENIKFLVNMNLKLSTNFLSNKYQIENLAGNFSQFPFPEDPLPFNTTYHGFPTYYIDFKKSFVYRLPTDLACERFDIENSDLNNFLIKIKPVEKINEIKKIYLPVFVKNNYLQKEEFVLFGLLKYMQGSNDEKNTNMELFCFPWNFLEFCVIWEEISKFGMINENIVQKLNIYFQKVPIYYSSYFFQLFQFKNYHDLCIKKWKFLSSPIDLTMHISNIKKNAYEKNKLKTKVENEALISKQLHLKHESSCCDMKQITERNKSILLNPFSEKRKRNIIEELLISKAKCLSLKNSEMIQDKLFINFLKKTDKIKTEKKIIEIEFEKQTIVNNNYELRSPYLEENEIKYVKEPVPYGNPFKLVLRSKTPKMMVTGEVSDEAYLANIIQEKDISKNTKLKGVPKNNNLIETSNTKSERNEKEFSTIKEINENLKDNSRDFFKTTREKTHPNEYSEIMINTKYFKPDLKSMHIFFVENSQKFLELNYLLNESESSQEKIKRIKNFVQEWLNRSDDIIIQNNLKKKINEILEFHSIIQEIKF